MKNTCIICIALTLVVSTIGQPMYTDISSIQQKNIHSFNSSVHHQVQRWNSNNSLMLLKNGWIVEENSGTVIHSVDMKDILSGTEPAWSPTQPYALFILGNTLLKKSRTNEKHPKIALIKYELNPNKWSQPNKKVIHVFNEFDLDNCKAKLGKLSDDGRYIALAIKSSNKNHEVFTFDLVNKVKLTSTFIDGELDWVAMSPSGKFVLAMSWIKKLNSFGLTAYDRTNMQNTGVINLSRTTGSLATDQQGNEFFIYPQNQNPLFLKEGHFIIKAQIPWGITLDNNDKLDEKATIISEKSVPLLELNPHQQVQLSCKKNENSCMVLTHININGKIKNNVLKIPIDVKVAQPYLNHVNHKTSSISISDSCGMIAYWANDENSNDKQLMFTNYWGKSCLLNPYLVTLDGDSIPYLEEKMVHEQTPIKLKYNYQEQSIEIEINKVEKSSGRLNLDLFDINGNQIGAWNFQIKPGTSEFKRILYTGYLAKGIYLAYGTQENKIHMGKIFVSSF